MGRARNIGFYALFSKIFCFRLQIGVSYQLLKERGSKLAQIFACGIKIDAAFGSGISAVTSKLMPFWLPPHLFPVGEANYQGVFEKTFKNSVAARKSGYCPFTYSMFESHFVTPSLIPSGKGIFLSSFQKNSAHLTHIWKPFCQPIRRGFLLQFLTATFATEKRHDFWKNFPSTLYRNFRSRKTTYFPKLFQKMFSPLYRTFSGKKRTHFFKKVFLNLYRKFFWANLNTGKKLSSTPIPQHLSRKSNPHFRNYCSITATGTFEVQNGTPIQKKA